MSNKKETEISIYDRIWKLQTKLNMMVLDGKRDPERFAEVLQAILNEKVYLKRLFEDEVITFGDTKVFVYELATNATFQEMFGDIGEKRRCWKDKEEALAFAKKHKDKFGPNGNFFELEGGFVADVRLDGGGQPFVYDVRPLSRDRTWDATYLHRVFSPQQ